ncbi:MAG: hypothetical protein ACXW3Q_14655 [Rhodoplanes sp.]
MLDKLDRGELALRIDADQHMDRLAGVADGVGEIGREIDEAQQPFAGERGDDRRIALLRSQMIGFGKELLGLRPWKEVGQLTRRDRWSTRSEKREYQD